MKYNQIYNSFYILPLPFLGQSAFKIMVGSSFQGGYFCATLKNTYVI